MKVMIQCPSCVPHELLGHCSCNRTAENVRICCRKMRVESQEHSGVRAFLNYWQHDFGEKGSFFLPVQQ